MTFNSISRRLSHDKNGPAENFIKQFRKIISAKFLFNYGKRC